MAKDATLNLLLVEDDLDIQRIYFEKLSANNYNVLIAPSSDTAMTIIKQKPINIILLDIMIPGKINGMELLKYTKDNPKTKKIPVIVLTNLDTEKEEAKKLGASDYLLKANMDPDQILEKLNNYR